MKFYPFLCSCDKPTVRKGGMVGLDSSRPKGPNPSYETKKVASSINLLL